MNKSTIYFGIDISKDSFDVMDSRENYYQFSNDYKGFRKFLSILDSDAHCVMEATGYYHCKLAYYLIEKGIKISVENPLVIKRFIQMKLSKVKTDRSDAKMICLYAQNTQPKLWRGQTKNQQECLQMMSLLETYVKQSTALKNKIHGEKVLGEPSTFVVRSLQKSLRAIHREIKMLEEKLESLIKSEHRELLSLIESIPGIGRKTAISLIVLTDGFNRFSNSSELCSFAGITPTIRVSGSSIRGQARISKVGNRKLRNLLFLCSFTASQYNRPCKELFLRITAKGKSKKLALIAVSNKLLKQAFAIAKTRIPFDENYRSYNPGLR